MKKTPEETTREEIVRALEEFGAKKQTENTYFLDGHCFFIKKLEGENNYQLIEL